MEFLHNLLLLPYNLFAYIFSIVIWWLIALFIIRFIEGSNGGDWFQYEFNRFIMKIQDGLWYMRGRILDVWDGIVAKFKK
tara:strand:+ start:994 stop:1233 length:240 start_codon:yes stop_codon:yes gene_type:complete